VLLVYFNVVVKKFSVLGSVINHLFGHLKNYPYFVQFFKLNFLCRVLLRSGKLVE